MTAISFPGAASAHDRPTRLPADAVDAAFVTGLGLLGLIGLRALYGGVAYLLVGLLGMVLGVAVTELARRWRQPVLAEVFVALIAFLLLGGAVAAPTSALAGVLPTPSTLSALGHVGIYGWKELLTTAPPVGNSSDLLALPYIIGLIGGVAGQSIAWRTRSAVLPLAGPVMVLALGILFGARHPSSLVLQGAIFGTGALAWTVVRHHRFRRVIGRTAVNRSRVMVSLGLLGVAGLVAGTIGPHLPGSGRSRLVLSRYVVPPFEANKQPSPLAGFRQYVKGGALYSAVLFTASGARSGSQVRIATMDEYDGIVWGFGAGATGGGSVANDAFQRFGSAIPQATSGSRQTTIVRIGDLGGVWPPSIGQVTRISFAGANASQLTKDFRFDLATSTAAEPAGLHPGDTYTLVGVEPPMPTSKELGSAGPGDQTVPLTGVPTVVQTDANQWASGASSAWGKVMAIANHLLTTGYYSDGPDPAGPAQLSAPGHGAGRLKTFLSGGGLVGTDIVGNDEQYAATLALMSNSVGVPARVVVGAELGPGGVVHGSDIHAWVEVSLAGLGWVPINWRSFVPTRPAHETPPMPTPESSSSAPVEPPVASALHSPPDNQLGGSSTASASRNARHKAAGFRLPAWVATLAWALLVPLLMVSASMAAVAGMKLRRRRRRRRAATTSAQIAGAWAELIDVARDYGHAVPNGRTRREQASVLDVPQAVPMATRADAAVFAPGDPSASQADDYWTSVEQFAGMLRSQLSRRQRWRATLSLRSFRPKYADPTGVA